MKAIIFLKYCTALDFFNLFFFTALALCSGEFTVERPK